MFPLCLLLLGAVVASDEAPEPCPFSDRENCVDGGCVWMPLHSQTDVGICVEPQEVKGLKALYGSVMITDPREEEPVDEPIIQCAREQTETIITRVREGLMEGHLMPTPEPLLESEDDEPELLSQVQEDHDITVDWEGKITYTLHNADDDVNQIVSAMDKGRQDEEDILKLTKLQHADGHFELSEELLGLLSIDSKWAYVLIEKSRRADAEIATYFVWSRGPQSSSPLQEKATSWLKSNLGNISGFVTLQMIEVYLELKAQEKKNE